MSLFGAFAYAELGTHFKESGGDYIYLSRGVHLYWAIFLHGRYLLLDFSALLLWLQWHSQSWLLLVLQTILDCNRDHYRRRTNAQFTINQAAGFQNITTLIKVLFIICLVVLGFSLPDNPDNALLFDKTWKNEIGTTGFAVSMVYVSLAYVGWNAAAYVADEIYNPRKNLPEH